MKKLSLNRFDLGVLIAFAVITIAGVAGWWYLSGALTAAQDEVKAAKTEFDTYSTKSNIVVSSSNGNLLQANNDLIKAQLEPLIQSRLLSKENKLSSLEKKDPVAWKHELDDSVHKLNAEAKAQGVAVPNNFYFGFSRYISQSPGDQQTAVLSRQLLGIKEIATILIKASVKNISYIHRSYEEDPHAAIGAFSPAAPEGDRLVDESLDAPGKAYTTYPFEIAFETSTENLRPVVNSLVQSPYLFIIRTISVENAALNSPVNSDLDRIAGTKTATPSILGTSPGEVARTPVKGPQYLFGSSTIKIKARIDMIQWNAKDLK